jgi:hypothetical protein
MNFNAIASLVIQTVIAGFLIWYTIETFKLRKEASYQREIAIQPLLDHIYDSKNPPGVFSVENVGIATRTAAFHTKAKRENKTRSLGRD